MLEVKKNLKGLITKIYELQKRINFNNQRIQLFESNDTEVSDLQDENRGLKEKILELQKKLKERFNT